ncbi:ATPase synthesis protein 25 mitochondrial [Bachmanniomyces sp. S44760]|nr:ATPase synthesis protein 25 mitochondrial [Bachmanniomyces sp. S44760]
MRRLGQNHSSKPIAVSRPFSASPRLGTENESHEEQRFPPPDLDLQPQTVPGKEDLPWYLQVDLPERPSNSLLQRQQLPELPADPPPLLQPVLEYASMDLGIDDLSILDLRDLEPPPALGANLLMVLGTARSEKHLHVSADRLCRWLRTKHQLSPYADGLLGRNELKIKMRRKARRSKLLGKTSSKDNADDGIRTGWVCVNAGTIQELDRIEEEEQIADGVIGFGGQVSGVKLIVQMLTEEKREELNLEGLWNQTLSRQQRKEVREAEAVAKDMQDAERQKEQEVGCKDFSSQADNADNSVLFVDRGFTSPNLLISHRRPFHTCSTRNYSIAKEHQLDSQGLHASDLEPPIRVQNLDWDTDKASDLGKLGEFPHLKILRNHLDYLKKLSREEAIEVLGRGDDDFNSTTFLTSFYNSIPLLPDVEHFQCRVDMVSYAITEIHHPGFSKRHLMDIYAEIRSSYIDIPSSLHLKVLGAILTPSRGEPPRTKLQPFSKSLLVTLGISEAVLERCETAPAAASIPFVSPSSLINGLEILQDMSVRGDDIFSEDVFAILIRAVLFAPGLASKPDRVGEMITQPQSRLIKLMLQLRVRITKDDNQFVLLRAFAESNEWGNFWHQWREPVINFQHRSAAHYTVLFECLASSEHQTKCFEALMTLIPDMEREEPPVILDNGLANSIMSCVKVADPNIEQELKLETNNNGWFVRLWNRCAAELEA